MDILNLDYFKICEIFRKCTHFVGGMRSTVQPLPGINLAIEGKFEEDVLQKLRGADNGRKK
jgi:hypothetical protein